MDNTNNIGGLWLNKDSKKKTFMYGKIKHTTVAIFKNHNKTSENSPDYIVKETKPKKKQEQELETVPVSGNYFHQLAEKNGVPF